MDAVILQFSTSLEWSSAFIRRICHSRFSHVDFILKDGSCLGASDSPLSPYLDGNPRGVAIRPPDYQDFGIRRRAVIPTPKADAIYAAAIGQLGKPFDNDALHQFLSGALAPTWLLPDQWFCAELCAWAFYSKEFFAYPLVVNLGRISPPELLILLNPYFDVESFEKRVEGLTLGHQET